MASDPWRTIHREVAYANKWIRVVDHDFEAVQTGAIGRYGVVETLAQAVSIVAVDDEDQVCLIEEYRFPLGRYLWRVPMGSVAMPGQSPLEAAQAELWEETGVEARNWRQVGATEPMSGLCSERALVFLAREISKNSKLSGGRASGDEVIRNVAWFPVADIRHMVASGRLTDGQAIAAIYIAAENDYLL
jgi:8-oxo-dGTP pyrophosphatase MutT (NUDIX family)